MTLPLPVRAPALSPRASAVLFLVPAGAGRLALAGAVVLVRALGRHGWRTAVTSDDTPVGPLRVPAGRAETVRDSAGRAEAARDGAGRAEAARDGAGRSPR